MRKNKGFLELRRLEAARDIAAQLAASGNKVMLDSQSLLLNGKFSLSASVCEDTNSVFQLLEVMRKKSLKVINRSPSVYRPAVGWYNNQFFTPELRCHMIAQRVASEGAVHFLSIYYMPSKRRLSKTIPETSDANCGSEDETPDTKKVRWNSAATTSGEVDSETEEPESDRIKVISEYIVHLCYSPTSSDANGHILYSVCFVPSP